MSIVKCACCKKQYDDSEECKVVKESGEHVCEECWIADENLESVYGDEVVFMKYDCICDECERPWETEIWNGKKQCMHCGNIESRMEYNHDRA